ncbi:MAG: Rap1a/Tai family immunity protein [Gammaproteobacteria bacterium]
MSVISGEGHSFKCYSIENGEDLLAACDEEISNDEDAINKLYCIAYISGIVDGAQLAWGTIDIAKEHTGTEKLFCLPAEGITSEMQLEIVISWLKASPEHLIDNKRLSIFRAFQNAFPCN